MISFGRGAIILFFTSGLSYTLGLMRDRVLAGTFGASDALDAYQAAFIIPDFIFNLFLAGALTAAFIPVYTDIRTRHKIADAAQLAGAMLTYGLLLLLIVAIFAFLLSPMLTHLVSPGFSATKQQLLTNLTRIMLLSPLLFLVSNLLGGMLVSSKRFLFYGLSPALYNLGIILGAVLLSPAYGIYGVAIGTVIGATLHLAIRAYDVRRAKLALLPSLRLSAPARQVLKLMLPRVVGLTAVQFQLWIFVAIASTLGEGAITVYSLGRNFQSFPVSLIGIALATSLFPVLAEQASKQRLKEFRSQLLQGTAAIIATIVPTAFIIYLLRLHIIQFFVGVGNFDAQAVALTAAVLGVYTLSIPTESLVHLLARGFYALQNTLIPVIVSLITITVTAASSYYLAQIMGVAGIPAGFAIGTGLQALLLGTLLYYWSGRVLSR